MSATTRLVAFTAVLLRGFQSAHVSGSVPPTRTPTVAEEMEVA